MKSKPLISIVTPYYNKRHRIKYLLESINRQQRLDLLEVLVVDDGAQIPLAGVIDPEDYRFKLEIIRIQNSGRSIARNTGFSRARGELIFFIDDDIILHPAFLETYARIAGEIDITKHFFHVKILDLVHLFPFRNPESGEYYSFFKQNLQRLPRQEQLLSFQNVFDRWEEFSRANQRMRRLEKLIQVVIHAERYRRFHWISCVSGCLGVPARALQEVGGFDPGFKVWGGEDLEFGYRLLHSGLSAYTGENDLFVYHITHAHNRVDQEINESSDYFMQKWNDPLIPLIYKFLDREYNQVTLLQELDRLLLPGADR